MQKLQELVHKPNQTIMMTNKDISAVQRKAYNVVLYEAQQQLRDDENKSTFLFQISKLKEMAGIKATDNFHIKNDLKALRDIDIDIVYDKAGEDWDSFSLISEARKRGDLLSIQLPQTIVDALKLKDKKYYTTLDLITMRTLKGKYAIILYEIALRYKNVQIPEFTIDEFRALTGTEDRESYNNFARLKAKVIEPAIKEINKNTDIIMTWEVTQKKGRKIEAIKFKSEKKETMKYISEDQISITDIIKTESRSTILERATEERNKRFRPILELKFGEDFDFNDSKVKEAIKN